MLILSRKAGETIEIPSLGVRFVVLKVRGNHTVKVGVDAPKCDHVGRGVAEKPKREKATR